MTMPPEALGLGAMLAAARPARDARLAAPGGSVRYRAILEGAVFGDAYGSVAGKSVIIGAPSQLLAALAMIELDGLAARIAVAPPDFSPEALASMIDQAKVDIIACDDRGSDFGAARPRIVIGSPTVGAAPRAGALDTEWVLPTSGTTGAPKLVGHRLGGLLGAVQRPATDDPLPVWATFYDIRRYGGLQVFLRAVTAGATLVLTEADESLADHVARMAAAGVTHLTGTPSHWRRLLMSPDAVRISPRYIRLSGEIADRAILDGLKAAFPQTQIVHAYASTEAGVSFEVTDGDEGFPAAYLDGFGQGENRVDMRIVDDTLRIRSRRTAQRYVGVDRALADAEGFVDTDDLVERRGERFYFKGRRAGTINVGGLKVSPEEVEQVINRHEAVRMSLVKARRSPITGDLIVADVVLKDGGAETARQQTLRDEILADCRALLARYKAPVSITFVSTLEMNASGKLKRRHA